MMSLSAESTNISPIIGIYKILPENNAKHAMNPPSANEPVSPIKIFAGNVLTAKKARTPPATANAATERLDCCGSPINATIAPKNSKYTKLVPPARPSRPSVKLTELTTAKITTIANGIIPQPILNLSEKNVSSPPILK